MCNQGKHCMKNHVLKNTDRQILKGKECRYQFNVCIIHEIDIFFSKLIDTFYFPSQGIEHQVKDFAFIIDVRLLSINKIKHCHFLFCSAKKKLHCCFVSG